jgi:hypothetical protein
VSAGGISEESPERVLVSFSTRAEIQEGGTDSILLEDGPELKSEEGAAVFAEFLVDLLLVALAGFWVGTISASTLVEGFDTLRRIFRGLEGPGSDPEICDTGGARKEGLTREELGTRKFLVNRSQPSALPFGWE